ncbi:MAG: pyridoxamine kinase [Oscillospiraceae bacterium]|nr:pyridoxamine kinase [Oscillospiraceae bacterium]
MTSPEISHINTNKVPSRVCAIHDLSGFGRCSLSVIIPVLAAMGIQPCPVPTAILSTHTGGFNNFTFFDYTPYIRDYYSHWSSLGVKFDAIYSGFLGSAEQINLVGDIINTFPEAKTVLIDPVMGDDGILYSTYTDPLKIGMKELVKKATIITPNLTEACFLLDIPYVDSPTDYEIRQMLLRLSEYGADTVITGIHRKNSVCTGLKEALNGNTEIFENEYIPKSYPGTGDIFASVLLGSILKGRNLICSVEDACDFVHDTVEYSAGFNYPLREGVLLEPRLFRLIEDNTNNPTQLR